MNIPTTIPLEELRLITRLFKQGNTHKAIKIAVDADRKKKGTFTGKGVSTNTISRLSPQSKHRLNYETTVRETWADHMVVKGIMGCLRINENKARNIYQIRILNSGISPHAFYNPNVRGLVDIRNNFLSCDAAIYIVFTSEDYESIYDDGDDPYADVWQVETDFTYLEIIKGKVTIEDIQEYLAKLGTTDLETGKPLSTPYEPIFMNTLIKRR